MEGGENGSGGWLSDILFQGGQYGFLGGNQQYTVSDLIFLECANGVGLIWDWAWVSKPARPNPDESSSVVCVCMVGLTLAWGTPPSPQTWSRLIFLGCDVAINLDPPGASESDPVGSIYLVDTQFSQCDTMIRTFPFRASEQGTTVFTFDNIRFSGNNHFSVSPTERSAR